MRHANSSPLFPISNANLAFGPLSSPACVTAVADFEYSCNNPRGADLGNTWCECCDFNNSKADMEKEYPRGEKARWILKRYLSATDGGGIDEARGSMSEGDFLAGLEREVNRFSVATSLAWCFWSLVQDDVSAVEFNYLKYGRERWEGALWLGRILEGGE